MNEFRSRSPVGTHRQPPFLTLPQDPEIPLQWGLLLFPLSPFLGGLGAIVSAAIAWRKKLPTILARRRNWVLLAFCLLAVLAAAVAENPAPAFLGLFNFLPFIAVFVAFCEILRRPTQLRRMAWILVAASLPTIVIGMGQMYSGWEGPIKLWMIVDWPLAPRGNPVDRMASVFEYANVLANYALTIFVLGLGLWIETYKELKYLDASHKETRYEGRLRWRWRLINIIQLGNIIVLIWANSRSGWAIAVLATIGFALYLGRKAIVAVVGAAAAVVLGAAFAPPPVGQGLRTVVPRYFWARLSDELYGDRPVELLRSTQWQFAWHMTLDRPWTGWGWRNFTELYQAQTQLWLGHPHNLMLMLSAEAGIPAALLLCGLVGVLLYGGANLVRYWPGAATSDPVVRDDRLIFFSYLMAFSALAAFHLFDVTLFDSRINILGWTLLAAICGTTEEMKVRG